ncbi:MAG: DUF6090 family protein [Gillisia sp.]|nr:DUF6090 family protein [Gillisia sp.]
MIKFFRKIRQKLLAENKFSKYLVYAIGEILLVVIGILIALQVNNWNEHRKSINAEKQYYKNIKRQLQEDIIVIKSNIDFNQRYYKQYQYAIQLINTNNQSNLDSLGIIAINLLEYSDFHQETYIYQTLVSSGEIKLLNNQKIIEGLQRLEETYIYINRLEDTHFDIIKVIYPELQKIIRFKPIKIEKADKLFEFEFQNHFVIVSEIMTEKDEIYKQALSEIDSILGMINEELIPVKIEE